jgi:hypothetical protein
MNIIKKLIKYNILFFILFLSIIFITKSKINISESLLISLIGTTTFAVIDQYAPSYIINKNKLKY